VLAYELTATEVDFPTYNTADLVEVITPTRKVFPVRMCHCMTSAEGYDPNEIHGFPLDLEWGVKLTTCKIRILTTRAT
jgi:hypothetical protein